MRRTTFTSLALALSLAACSASHETTPQRTDFDDGYVVSTVHGDRVVTEEFDRSDAIVATAILVRGVAAAAADGAMLRGINHLYLEGRKSDRLQYGNCEDESEAVDRAWADVESDCEGMTGDNATPRCWDAVDAFSDAIDEWLGCLQAY